tara:strand:+ start:143 stop:511 length:369 start_codon:yes stop_codon:yes gene_type:complete
MQSIILDDIRILLRIVELEVKPVVFNFFLLLLISLLLSVLDQVDVVLFEALWHIEINLNSATYGMLILVFFLVLNCSDLVVSNKLSVFLLCDGEVVVAHPAFVSNLVGDELRMVSGWDALVY